MNKIINRLDSSMKSTRKVCEEFGFKKQHDELCARREQYGKQPVTLLVCGEFKRGKSSFINAFLNENICAEGIGITTAAVSIIRYGATKRVIRSYGNVGGENVKIMNEEISFENIEQFSKGKDISDTVLLEIELPNERLKAGLVLIDTPGVGSLDPRHRMLTLYALPRANAVLFMTDAGEEVMASEGDFYKTYIAPLKCPKRILLNKIDQASEDEIQTLVNDTKKKLGLSLNVDAVPFSAELWKEYNASQDKDLYEASHASEVEKSIEILQTEYWEQYAVSLRDDYAIMLAELSQSIDIRIAELKESSDINEKIRALQERMMEIAKLKRELSDNTSGKRGKINEMIKSSQERILSEFQKESVLLSTEKLKGMIAAQAYSKTGEDTVVKQMNAEVAKLQATLDKRIDNSCAQIANMAEQSILLPTMSVGPFPIEKSNKVSKKPLSERILTTVQNSYSPALLGGVLGTAVATPLLGVFAPFIGLAVGIGGIVVACRRSNAAARKSEMLDHIQPRVTIAMNELRMYIQKKYELFSKTLFEQLAELLEKLDQELKRIMAMLQKCEADKKQRVEQIAALEQNKKFIDEQLIQTKTVGSDPLSINHAC